jgi:site-specific DNA-methyltransferase (adenine-specific)
MGARNDMIFDLRHQNFTDHPCEKSESVWTKILLRGSVKDSDIIFDPFLGSGTTLLACRKTGRTGLGFEINPDYEHIIQKRMMEDIPAIDGWF